MAFWTKYLFGATVNRNKELAELNKNCYYKTDDSEINLADIDRMDVYLKNEQGKIEPFSLTPEKNLNSLTTNLNLQWFLKHKLTVNLFEVGYVKTFINPLGQESIKKSINRIPHEIEGIFPEFSKGKLIIEKKSDNSFRIIREIFVTQLQGRVKATGELISLENGKNNEPLVTFNTTFSLRFHKNTIVFKARKHIEKVDRVIDEYLPNFRTPWWKFWPMSFFGHKRYQSENIFVEIPLTPVKPKPTPQKRRSLLHTVLSFFFRSKTKTTSDTEKDKLGLSSFKNPHRP